jgi:hypothetical protein
MTATATDPREATRQAVAVTIRLHLAHRAAVAAANAILDAEDAIATALAYERRATADQLDALEQAKAALDLAKLEARGLVKRRRELLGTTRHPDALDDKTVAMSARMGIASLRDGRHVDPGTVVIVTGDEAVTYARLGHLVLAEAPPAWWPRGIVDYSGYDAAVPKCR